MQLQEDFMSSNGCYFEEYSWKARRPELWATFNPLWPALGIVNPLFWATWLSLVFLESAFARSMCVDCTTMTVPQITRSKRKL